jgi:hypothetical protein
MDQLIISLTPPPSTREYPKEWELKFSFEYESSSISHEHTHCKETWKAN